MGGIIDFFNPKKVAQVYAPPPRTFESELGNILSQSEKVYQNTAQYVPKYADLATKTASTLASGYGGIADTVGQANSDLLSKFGGQYVTNLRGMNTNQSGLMDELNRQARAGLAAGGRMTPDQQYYATNAVRSNYAGRGFQGSLPQGLDEAVALARMGDNVQGQRQDFVGNLAGMENNFYTGPAAAMAMGSGGASASDLLGAGGSMGGTQQDAFNSLLSYGSDLMNTNYNAQAAANIATANNKSGIYSSAMSY